MAKVEYCVIGYGRFGGQVADQLNELGKRVMVIEADSALCDKISRLHEIVIKADATDINALADCGVKNINNVIVGTSAIENSIMICANLRQLGVENIIARAKNSTHERVLKTMGITNVITPEIEIANKLAIQLVYNLGADISAINKQICWVKTVVTNPDILHKNVFAFELKEKYDALIITIQRKDQIIFPITKVTQFKIGDIVSIVCPNDNIKKIISILTQNK
ncbi:MAG: TrkA family potassium uptake protein [Mycoplasmoidaceae bacterium]|nr:TrkA family potassium uptake protein [Mycoplasmoidaceae bacterium]